MAGRERPTGLAECGGRLWDAVTASHEVSDAQAELLLLACKQADRAAEARLILQSVTLVGVDRFGQEKAHPAVDVERKASSACVNLLASIVGKAAAKETVEQEEDFFG